MKPFHPSLGNIFFGDVAVPPPRRENTPHSDSDTIISGSHFIHSMEDWSTRKNQISLFKVMVEEFDIMWL